MKNPFLPASLWKELDGRLWHSTSTAALAGIALAQRISVSTADRYKNSYCRVHDSVSLFDFGPSAKDQTEFTASNWFGWFGSQQGEPLSIWLEIDRKLVLPNLISQETIRTTAKPIHRFFVGVECCHIGPIPIAAVKSALLVNARNIGDFFRAEGTIHSILAKGLSCKSSLEY